MTSVKQAVVLAGGLGTRLRPLTLHLPKPLVEVNNRPFAEYLVDLLKDNGITEVVFLTGYLGQKIEDHFGDGSKFGVRIKYSHGKVSDETGARLRNTMSLLHQNFLLMYCDNYWPLNLEALWNFHRYRNTPATVTVYSNKFGVTKNNILVDGEGIVRNYDRTRSAPNLNGVDLGFFILNKDLTSVMPDHNFSLEDELLPALVAEEKLAGFVTHHRHYSIGKLDHLPQTGEFLKSKKVVFLDRDGVINENPASSDYVKKWEEFRFLEGAKEAIGLLTKNNCKIFVITNQSGVARGMMTAGDLTDIHEKMIKEIENYGGAIAGIYHCSHGWDDNCECRKPKPGLLFQAAHDHHLDLTRAVFIGDREKDMLAGKAAGCRTFLISPDKNLFQIVQSII